MTADIMSEINPRLEDLCKIGLLRSFDVLPKGHVRLQTAFHYPDGSDIDLFICKEASLLEGVEPIELTDFGYTLSWLGQLGINPLKSQRRRKLLEDVLNTYNVREFATALKCRVTTRFD